MSKDDHSRNPISCGVTIPDVQQTAGGFGLTLSHTECRHFLADNQDAIRYLLERSKAMILGRLVGQHYASIMPEPPDELDDDLDDIERYIRQELFDAEAD
jgi:hypothetical protein